MHCHHTVWAVVTLNSNLQILSSFCALQRTCYLLKQYDSVTLFGEIRTAYAIRQAFTYTHTHLSSRVA